MIGAPSPPNVIPSVFLLFNFSKRPSYCLSVPLSPRIKLASLGFTIALVLFELIISYLYLPMFSSISFCFRSCLSLCLIYEMFSSRSMSSCSIALCRFRVVSCSGWYLCAFGWLKNFFFSNELSVGSRMNETAFSTLDMNMI